MAQTPSSTTVTANRSAIPTPPVASPSEQSNTERPALKLHWFLPTYGDSRFIVGGGHGLPAGAARGDRPASIGYLSSIARAAEDFGFTAALTPTGAWCEDAWLTTAMIARESERLGFLVALRPGLVSPTLAAQMAATFSRHAPGRLLLNVVTGGEPHEQRAFGDFLDKPSRYARTDEFLTVVRGLWRGERVTHRGRHLQVDDAALHRLPAEEIPIYFGGSSPEAGPVAARHSDVYLTWGEPPAAVAAKIDWIRGLAAQRGRTVRFGIRLHVISRDTADEAWTAAAGLLAALDEDTVRAAQEGLARSESAGQAAMRDLHAAHRGDGSWRDPRALEVAENLWAGVGLVRGGAGTALVGSHAEVADRIAEYAALGIDEFVLSGYPHLEELYWFGEGVIPQLVLRGLFAVPGNTPGRVAAAPFQTAAH
ncbi:MULTISPECIES: LLM class flavin-dependent oxidoreductase [Gordonia]|uniref:Alkanesulfonate monooxygenase n=1 Tax=Gordonia sihwensis NBRC 108236 TaxID=1223544 RepID=L7LFN6_9ACTN|nr:MULTISPECIES: LLM class flavin-dependent oxidoreductase [Gordonia]AUH68991.1 LLM class flavin-dependent oxidoreductase [Gordonia sp. YC-JH1]MBY4570688.1 alkanesulfonate monooxygenase [Gordonia sihwensis]GAC59709.1 alkanesulfonate monooxygenase [Gordonia sihwensis NBRC 108236]